MDYRLPVFIRGYHSFDYNNFKKKVFEAFGDVKPTIKEAEKILLYLIDDLKSQVVDDRLS